MESMWNEAGLFFSVLVLLVSATMVIPIWMTRHEKQWEFTDISEEEWEALWRKHLSARVLPPVGPTIAVITIWLNPATEAYVPLLRIVLTVAAIALTGYHFWQTSKLVALSWSEARETRQARAVLKATMKKRTYSDDEIFGENGAVLKK